ncbi:MAG: hypothetical protein MI923_12290 [Phycisphaerales bacterium]|nr:hypothetical protein [Phycisphaerales bacterium]
MSLKTKLVYVVAAGLLSAFTGKAQALPPDQSLEYSIYDGNVLVFQFRLFLSSKESGSGEVGWNIDKAEFHQPGTNGGDWVKDNPTVDTPDGLWWVDHADVQKPEISEFCLPPLLEGLATSEDPADDDLDYSLEGRSYTPPPEGKPFNITVALDYIFQRVGAAQPEESGDDEPAELDEVPGSGA